MYRIASVELSAIVKNYTELVVLQRKSFAVMCVQRLNALKQVAL